jgi:hypothetical protein
MHLGQYSNACYLTDGEAIATEGPHTRLEHGHCMASTRRGARVFDVVAASRPCIDHQQRARKQAGQQCPASRYAESWSVRSAGKSGMGRRQSLACEKKTTGKQRAGLSTSSGVELPRSSGSRLGRPKKPSASGTCEDEEHHPRSAVSLESLARELRKENASKYPEEEPERRGKLHVKPLVLKAFREPAHWKNLTPSSRQALNEVAKVYPNIDPAFYLGFLKRQGLEQIRQGQSEG